MTLKVKRDLAIRTAEKEIGEMSSQVKSTSTKSPTWQWHAFDPSFLPSEDMITEDPLLNFGVLSIKKFMEANGPQKYNEHENVNQTVAEG